MSGKFLNFLLWFSVLMISFNVASAPSVENIYQNILNHHQKFSLLIDFTCAVAKDELEKHPEMRTIAMVELENNFPFDFSRKVLKCLPPDVAKVILNPHTHIFRNNNSMILPKESIVFYVAEKVKWDFCKIASIFQKNYPVVHHLSKRLVISSDGEIIKEDDSIFDNQLNVAQIFEENRKVIGRYLNRTKYKMRPVTLDSPQQENLSQILFPDRQINFNGKPIHAAYRSNFGGVWIYSQKDKRPNCKWNYYLDIIAKKFNATVNYIKIQRKSENIQAANEHKQNALRYLFKEDLLDFYLNHWTGKKMMELEAYNDQDWCLVAPWPGNFSIVEQVLFLPLDKSCWMWLGITIATSTFVWRILEGHWNFPFGAFAYFVGQSAEIKTSRLMLKILLQILILTFFIFSNGYQSLVTSFMLDPVRTPLLKSVDEVLDSTLKIRYRAIFEDLQKDNPKYLKAKEEGRILRGEFTLDGRLWKRQVEEKIVSFLPCKEIKSKIEYEGDGKSWRKLYQIPEPVYSELAGLYVAPMHIYLDKFQELMDRTLEAGLHQVWERFFLDKHHKKQQGKRFGKGQEDEEDDVLDFKEIIPFFFILAVGFGAALLALLFEIFQKDFVSELSKEYFTKKFNKILRREIKVGKPRNKKIETRKLKMRKIRVRSRRNQIEPATRSNSI